MQHTFSSSEKKLIQKLHESEHFLEQVTNHVPDIIYVLDLHKNRFTYLNRRAKEVMGSENILLDKIHPLDYDRRMRHIAACTKLKKNEVKNIEIRMKVKSGEWHWFSIRDIAFGLSQDGNVTHTIGVARDIQDYKIREEERAHKELLLHGVLNAPNFGIVVYKAIRNQRRDILDYEFVLTSKAFNDFHQRYDLIGKWVFEEFPEVKKTEYNRWKEIVETGVNMTVRQPFSKNGKEHWFDLKLSKLNDGLMIVWEDITEKKLADEKILRSKNLLETVLAASPLTISTFKSVRNGKGSIIDFEYILVNDNSIKRAGGKRLVGRRMSEVYPDSFAELFDRLVKVAETGSQDSWEFCYKKGKLAHWYYLTVSKLEDGLLITALDITQLKLTEKWVLDERNLLEAILHASPLSIAVMKSIRDSKGNIVDYEYARVNPRSVQLAGKNLMGWRLSAARGITPEDELFKRMTQVVETGTTDTWEQRMREEEGDKWHYITAIKFEDGYVATSMDITHVKMAQERLIQSESFVKNILDSAPDAIMIYDAEKQCNIYSNDHVVKLLGYTPAEMKRMGNKVLERCIHPDDFQEQFREIKSLSDASDEEIKSHEYRVICKDGSVRWVNSKRSVFRRDESGRPTQIIVLLTDITGSKSEE